MNTANPQYLKAVTELAALNVANIEKLTELQIETINELTNAGIVALKKAADVKDLNAAKTYFEEQAVALRVVGENVATRSKSAVEISKEYPNNIKTIVEKTVAA